jgi:hypothetical protein
VVSSNTPEKSSSKTARHELAKTYDLIRSEEKIVSRSFISLEL